MNFQIVTILLVIIGFAVLVYLLTRKPKQDEGRQVLMEWLKEMRGSQEGMQKRLDQGLEMTHKSVSESNKVLNDRLDSAAKVIGALQKEFGGMSQIGPDIRKLSQVLASPKARGGLGEDMLEEMIRQILPSAVYKFQHHFRSGDAVDAVVKIGEKLLPIDSKFSMENYRLYLEANTDEAADNLKRTFLRDVKKRIDEIAKKYILPQENTYDFALMYVPSEGLAAEVLEDQGIIGHAREKNVHIVTPNSMYYWLQTIVFSLKRERINKDAQKVLQMIAGIKQESQRFGRNLEILSGHIKDANNSMGNVNSDYVRFRGAIENAANIEIEEKSEAEKADGRLLGS